MNKPNIVKNLKQIKQLLEEDSSYIATERIKWLISDIEKDYIITDDDMKYRQGRSRRQEENSEKLMFISSLILGACIFSIVVYGLLSG